MCTIAVNHIACNKHLTCMLRYFYTVWDYFLFCVCALVYLCILRPLRAIAWNLAHKRCLAPLCPCHQISNPYFWTPSFALRALHKALHRWLNFEVPIGRGIILDQALPLPLWYLCNTTPLLALAFRKTLQIQPLSSILSWISCAEYLCTCAMCCTAEIEIVNCISTLVQWCCST